MSCKNILIIDDESDIREIAKLSLSITNQWHVLTASSGKEGATLATQNRVDAILLDLIMPTLGGLDTLKLLKKNSQTADIPVILLTATARLAMKPEYAEWGVAGILIKPFDPGDLGDQIKEILNWDIKI